MNKWLHDTCITAPENHAPFKHIFDMNLREYATYICAQQAKLCDFDGNEDVPDITWEGRDIELCFVDCGRMMETNMAWYRIFSPFFIKNKTLIVMQDWQNYKAVPPQWWENTKMFTDRLSDSLDLIHEVRGSGIGTFLYRGQ